MVDALGTILPDHVFRWPCLQRWLGKNSLDGGEISDGVMLINLAWGRDNDQLAQYGWHMLVDWFILT